MFKQNSLLCTHFALHVTCHLTTPYCAQQTARKLSLSHTTPPHTPRKWQNWDQNLGPSKPIIQVFSPAPHLLFSAFYNREKNIFSYFPEWGDDVGLQSINTSIHPTFILYAS